MARRENPIDADNDNDNPIRSAHDGDDDIGQPANARDRRAIEAVVGRYYAAALHRDGSTACALLFTPFEESVPEDVGQPSGLDGKTCAAVAAKLFAQQYRHLAADGAKPKIVNVLIDGGRGWALFDRGPRDERRIVLYRESRRWTIGELLDTSMP